MLYDEEYFPRLPFLVAVGSILYVEKMSMVSKANFKSVCELSAVYRMDTVSISFY